MEFKMKRKIPNYNDRNKKIKITKYKIIPNFSNWRGQAMPAPYGMRVRFVGNRHCLFPTVR
jgi:hypothetical protein